MKYLYGVFQYSFIDSIWAFYHFLSGLLLGIIIQKKSEYSKANFFAFGIGLLVAWEVFEELIRELKTIRSFQAFLDFINQGDIFGPESAINVFGDIVLGGLGVYLVYFFVLRNKKLD